VGSGNRLREALQNQRPTIAADSSVGDDTICDMVSYIILALTGLAITYVANTYRCYAKNLAAAKKSGLPYICMPVYTFNRFWLSTHLVWLPIIKRTLPASWTTWTEYVLSYLPLHD